MPGLSIKTGAAIWLAAALIVSADAMAAPPKKHAAIPEETASPAAQPPVAPTPAAAPAEAASAGGTGLFDKVKSIFGGDGPSKVKQIDQVSAASAREFDPLCEALIEPFGITDNLLSLSQLAVKIGTSNILVKIGAGGQNMDLRGTLRMAGKNLNWLPMEAERLLGEKMLQDMEGDLLDGEIKKNRPAVQTANRLMTSILAQVGQETPYAFEIHVRKGAGNAQALPGGIILIDRDLVTEPRNEDKAYFALAHELSHVLQRHETRATQARLTDTIDSFDGFKKLIDTAGSNPGSILAYTNEVMSRFVVFSKAQEMQADACAVRLLDGVFPDKKRLAHIIRNYQAGLGPAVQESAAANQVDLLVQNMQKMDKLNELHPNSQERSANLEKMLGEVGKPKKIADASTITVHR